MTILSRSAGDLKWPRMGRNIWPSVGTYLAAVGDLSLAADTSVCPPAFVFELLDESQGMSKEHARCAHNARRPAQMKLPLVPSERWISQWTAPASHAFIDVAWLLGAARGMLCGRRAKERLMPAASSDDNR